MKINVNLTINDLDLLPEPLIQNFFPGIELNPKNPKYNYKKIKLLNNNENVKKKIKQYY